MTYQDESKVVRTDGDIQSGVTSTTQTTVDPATGSQRRQSSTTMWAGRSAGVDLVWLTAGVILAFLALDFIFHAFGANDVGFASFIYSVGSFFAAPFAGIFNTSLTNPGNLVVWADVLAMVVYALIAALLAKVVSIASNSRYAS